MRHMPEGTHSLAPRPGSLVRLAFQKWPAEPKLGARSLACHAVASCEGWSTWQDLHLHPSRFERDASAYWATRGGAHGRICTDTLRVLSAPSLHWTTWAGSIAGMDYWSGGLMGPMPNLLVFNDPAIHHPTTPVRSWCRVRDFHPQPLRSERSASCSWANAAKMALPAGLSPAAWRFEAARSDTLSYGSCLK